MSRPPRAPSFPYRGLHRYLVTVCTQQRRPWFADTHRARELTSQILPSFGARHFDVVAYCVMPDHVHLLLEGTSETACLPVVMSGWKQRTGYQFKVEQGARLWQPGYHDRVLREADDTRAVVRYVLNNPVRAGLVRSARDYPWLGSVRYTIADLETHASEWSPSWR